MNMIWFVIVLIFVICMLIYLLIKITGKKEILSTKLVLKKIERVAELTTAKLSLDVFHKIENGVQFLGTNKLYFIIIPVKINVYFDLTKTNEDDISISGDEKKRIDIILPSPKINIYIDFENINDIEVIDKLGLISFIFNKKEKLNLIKEQSSFIYETALNKAMDSGIIDISKESAVNFFEGLLIGMGFEKNEIKFRENIITSNKLELKKDKKAPELK